MQAYPAYNPPKPYDFRELILSRAAETPEDTAFFYTDKEGNVQKVSCAKVRDDVMGLGTYLMKNGFEGRHVALLGPNSYDWVVSFFALITTGAVILPMDARQPVPNLLSLLKMGDAEAIFISEEFEPAAPYLAPLKVLHFTQLDAMIAEGAKDIASGDTRWADYKGDREKMAVLAFTSGTTGTPKGVMLSEKNIIVNMIQASSNYEPTGPALSALPFHHMFGLVAGMLMVYNYRVPCFIVTSIRNMLKEFQVARPQTAFAVPMMIETMYKQFAMMARRAGGNITPEQVKQFLGGNLEYIICGGAPLAEMYVKAFRKYGIELLNGFGITECSPVLATNRNHDMCDGSVGVVLPGCEVKISDSGEILARGDNIMLGYYKNEEATKEAFEDGWYKTGDLGRIEDHYLFITGRIKNLIITSSGENISPEELEGKLLADPAVAEAIVYEKNGNLAVQIYPEEAAGAPEEYFKALVARVNEGEPAYRRIQKVIIRTEPFVRNTTGKILRQNVN